MSLLLAAALSGHGVTSSGDICRADSWTRPSFARQSMVGYIPPFADTPAAHAQTQRVSTIFNAGLRSMDRDQMIMTALRGYAIRWRLCGRGTQLVQPMARPVHGLSTTGGTPNLQPANPPDFVVNRQLLLQPKSLVLSKTPPPRRHPKS